MHLALFLQIPVNVPLNFINMDKEYNITCPKCHTKFEANDLYQHMEAEFQTKFDKEITKLEKRHKNEIKKIKGDAKLQSDDEYELKIKELEESRDAALRSLKEAVRKGTMGSSQTKGATQERAIASWLRSNFPLDDINEIGIGKRGADCVHKVNSKTIQNCGIIYYESKRTKGFKKGWIDKFKSDIRNLGATIGVLVTDSLPPGMERMGLLDGIYICTYLEFKGLCCVLRQNIVQLNQVISSQENKGDKMVMIYDFLVGNKFRDSMEAIVASFVQMQKDLDTERISITGHWKKRETQIQKVLDNTSFMYNHIQGITGNAIQPIDLLELPEESDEY